MARTQAQIKSEMTTPFMANPLLAALYGFVVAASFEATYALVSIENILFDIISFVIFTHEQMFDQHKKEVDTLIYNQKSGRKQWYKTMALNFLYGFSLVPDHDYYNLTGVPAEVIEAARVVKYAAVGESDTESRLIIKIAGETNGVLAPLSDEQRLAFDAYWKEIKWTVKHRVINYLPDQLFLKLKIKFDALVLNANGMSILNGNYPVNEALSEFMKELPFDGELRLSALIDKLQATEGVIDATLLSAETSWIDPTENGYGEPISIDISIIPQSGYFTIAQNNITYYT